MNFRKYFRQFSATSIAIAAFTFGMGQAAASVIFNFSFNGPTASGNGTLVADDNGNGSFTAISGSGWETIGSNTYLLTLFLNPGGTAQSLSPFGAYLYDNQLLPSFDPTLLIGGLLFTTSGGAEVNIWGTGPGAYFYSQWTPGVGYSPHEVTSFELTQVPEPATLTLFGIGLLGLAATRRKARKTENA